MKNIKKWFEFCDKKGKRWYVGLEFDRQFERIGIEVNDSKRGQDYEVCNNFSDQDFKHLNIYWIGFKKRAETYCNRGITSKFLFILFSEFIDLETISIYLPKVGDEPLWKHLGFISKIREEVRKYVYVDRKTYLNKNSKHLKTYKKAKYPFKKFECDGSFSSMIKD